MISSSCLGGALVRLADGWHWAVTGELEPLVHDATLEALVPAFPRVEFRRRRFVAVVDHWRAEYRWTGDWLAAQAVAELAAHAQRIPFLEWPYTGNSFASRSHATRPAALVPIAAWNALMHKPIAAWRDADTGTIVGRAQDLQDRAPLPDIPLEIPDDELDDELDLLRRRFLTAAAQARWSGRAAHALSAWCALDAELRFLYRGNPAGYAEAVARAWNSRANLATLEHLHAVLFAHLFGPP